MSREESKVRNGCRWSLRYGSKWYCKWPIFHGGPEEIVAITSGCPKDCLNYEWVSWKENYGKGTRDLEEDVS